jgi:hypothetical protein
MNDTGNKPPVRSMTALAVMVATGFLFTEEIVSSLQKVKSCSMTMMPSASTQKTPLPATLPETDNQA